MKSIADLLSKDKIKELAIPSNYRLGEEIIRDGKIEFLENKPAKIIAKVFGVSGSSTRTVEFKVSRNKLTWKCTCTKKPDWFCKHCVAAGLALES